MQAVSGDRRLSTTPKKYSVLEVQGFPYWVTYCYNQLHYEEFSLFVDPLPLRGAFFGSGSGPILLDNVVCRGTEPSLLQCNTNPVSENNCDHSEDAGVRCEGSSLQFSRYTQLKT